MKIINGIKSVLTWLVSELSLLLSGSSWEATKVDSSEADCVVEGVGVYREREWRLPASGSSSSSMPWWQSTKSTRSSFSLQVSVGMLRSSKYWRRSLTRRRMSRGRWKDVAFSKWHVAQMRRFSWSTEHREQKLFLQSQHIYCRKREWKKKKKTRWWKWGTMRFTNSFYHVLLPKLPLKECCIHYKDSFPVLFFFQIQKLNIHFRKRRRTGKAE